MTYVSEKVLEELENRIKSRDFKLNSLLEITNAINSNAPVSDILNIYNFVLTEQLGIRKFILFNHQSEWHVLDKVGIKGKSKRNQCGGRLHEIQ
jgi:sigma-B regulation protein RsbU (phosphoserine phosphatase)